MVTTTPAIAIPAPPVLPSRFALILDATYLFAGQACGSRATPLAAEQAREPNRAVPTA